MRHLISKVRLLVVNLDTRFQLILIGIIVGACSGLAAVGLNLGLRILSHHLKSFSSPLTLFLFPVTGIVLTVVFLKYVVRDFGGHGVPEVIASVSIKGGALKFRSAFSKLIGSLLTISAGGSAGPEAPVVISGAAIGSTIAKNFKSNEKIRVAVTGSGAAAAIASIFNAPIAGIIFTMEIILGEWTAANMLPVAISSVTGTIVSRMLNGNQIPFAHREFLVNINDILATVGLSVIIALLSLALIKGLKWSSVLLDKYLAHPLIKALIGGGIVGTILILSPMVGGEGYELVRELISEEFSSTLPILLGIICLKIIATSFTLNAGGSGGVFAPSLVIGSLCGLLFYQVLIVLFPQTVFTGASLFSLVAMAGMISGTMQAPLTGIFLIVEITGGYDAILPLLLISFLTVALVRLFEKHSIYHQELVQKGFLLRPRTDARVLADIRPEELLEKDVLRVYPEMVLKKLVPMIKKSCRNYFAVEDKTDKKFLGMLFFNDIKEYLFDSNLSGSIIVEEVMRTNLSTVSLDDSVNKILAKFDATNEWSLPVVKDQLFLGLISKSTILDHYRKELKAQTEQ